MLPGDLPKVSWQRINVSKQNPDLNTFAEPLSKDARYWALFLFADGSVRENGSIAIGLKLGDINHLRKLARFLKIDESYVHEYYRTSNYGQNNVAWLTSVRKELSNNSRSTAL
jgi:hypothetical protein